MKKIISLTTIFFLTVVLGTFGDFAKIPSSEAVITTGTWTQISAEITKVSSIAINPLNSNILYAGGKDGIFKTLDNGKTWIKIGEDLTSPEVKKIVINPVTPTTLYAVDYAIDRSLDGGATWTKISESFVNPRTTDLIIDPINPSILYACATTYFNYMNVPKSGGIWRSTNGGNTWTAINNGLASLWVQCLAIDPLKPTTLYAGTKDRGIFRSTDSGKTWLSINKNFIDWEGEENGGNIISLAVNPVTPNILYAGDNINGIYRSLDGGNSWKHLASFDRINWVISLAIDPAIPTTLYAGAEMGGAFKSEDSGDTWEILGTKFVNSYVRVFAFALNSSNFLYIGNSSGIYKYEENDGGEIKQSNIIVLKLGTSEFLFNGSVKTLDTPPIIKNGRTILPIRAIIQAFGGQVEWEVGEKKVTVVLGVNKIELWIGKNLALVNGESVKIDTTNAEVVPEIVNNRTMLPVRFVSESLGCEVVWGEKEKTITITWEK